MKIKKAKICISLSTYSCYNTDTSNPALPGTYGLNLLVLQGRDFVTEYIFHCRVPCILTPSYGKSTNGNVIKFTIGLQLCINILLAIPLTRLLFMPSRRCPDGVINDPDYQCLLSTEQPALCSVSLGSLLTLRTF